MTINQKALLIIIALEIVFIPLFLKYMWPKKNKKSLAFKQLCSLVFVTAGFLCMSISNNKTAFAIAMICGLICGFFGDFFLHLNGKIYFGIGAVFFLINHLFYCYAYTSAKNKLFPESNKLSYYVIEGLAVFAILAIVMIYAKSKKLDFMGLKPLIFIYVFVLSLMFIKSLYLGILLLKSDLLLSGIGSSMLISGSSLFFVSDFSLGMIYFGGKTSYPAKCFNNMTYIFGQIALSLTILYIK